MSDPDIDPAPDRADADDAELARAEERADAREQRELDEECP